MVNISKIIHSLKGEVSQEEIKKDIKAASIIIRNTSLYVTLTAKVKKSKLIVRDMKNNQVMNETNIDKEGNACINITDSGVLEAPKIAFYIRIGEEEIRLKPDRKLSANLKGFSHVLELEDVLIVPYTTIKGNLSVKVIKRHYYGESDELPYGVSRVLVDNHKAELGGWLFSDNQTKSNSQITMKKRASNLSYRLPTIFDGNYWSAEVNLNDIHPSKGIWDFYLEVNNDKNYRILIENNLIENLDSQVFNVKRESRWHTFYKTKNDGLSSTVKSAAVQILDVKAEIVSKYKVKCSGTMDGAFINNDHDLEKAELFIAKRNNGKSHFEPIKLHPKEDDHYEFTFDLDYQEVISNRENEKHRWDVYLQIPFLDIKRRYRFRLNIKEIAYQSRVEFEGEKLNQIYFYPTVNEQLSIVQKDLSVERNIDTLNLANGHLNLSGYAYLDTVEWIEKEEVTRNLIIRERETEEDYKVPLKGKYNNLEKFGYRYHYSGFEVEVNLNEFISSTTRMKKVFDLYVEFKYKNIVKERRIGREEFDYFKDDVLAREVISREDGCEIAYITYTPSGNIKIETNHIPTEAMEYLSTEIRTPPEEEIWLIGERPNTAQDTGYHFFKFCRENYPDMKVYYAIESDSEDLLNIEHLGNVVHIGSIDHYKVASQATALIGSHDLEYFLPAKGIEFNSYKHGKRIFLQHGVLGRKNVEYHKQYYKYPFHVFCVSSQPEKKLVERKLGYNKEDVVVTGLTRFDSLLKNQDNNCSILFIPTWREWLLNERDFLDSEYYKKYKSMLQNKTLHQLLTDYDVELKFFPHYRMQPFINNFEVKHEKIKVLRLGEKTVQELLLESSLMITDYSSVSFDFNYMAKPVIFYHFDPDSFFRKGILRPIEETFIGDICYSEDELISTVKEYVKNNFSEKASAADKKHLIFSQMDKNNCQRVYNKVKEV